MDAGGPSPGRRTAPAASRPHGDASRAGPGAATERPRRQDAAAADDRLSCALSNAARRGPHLFGKPMSGPSNVQETLIRDRAELVDYLASGGKPESEWRIGTEHEKFGFRLDDLRPPTWDGPSGIEALLRGLTRFGWQPVEEHGKLIALAKNGASVTLEPAGQLELSGAMLENIHQT